jgi:hypothetical protein
VFRKFKDEPKNYEEMLSICAENLKNGIEYLCAKQIPIAAQEAMALLTGGMCPISLFNGKRTSDPSEEANTVDRYLDHSISQVKDAQFNTVVYELLSEGRGGNVNFDLKNSPLSAYFYLRT